MNCWQWIDEILALADLPPVAAACDSTRHWSSAPCWNSFTDCSAHRVEPRMTPFLALALGRSHYFDISRSRRDFGYRPRVSTRRDAATEMASGLHSDVGCRLVRHEPPDTNR